MPEHSSRGNFHEDRRQVVEAAQQRLREAPLSRPMRRTAEYLVAQVRRAGTYREAREAVEAATADLARLTELVAAVGADLQERQARRSEVRPFGGVWQDAVLADIAAAGDNAPAVWIRRYAEAFVAGRFEACRWLIESSAPPVDRDLARRMFTSARAAHDANLAASLPALETLTESALAGTLPADLRLKAWCMRLRAIARGVGDPPRARDLARGLLDDLPPETPLVLAATLRTVFGECLLASDDPDEAARQCGRALQDAPGEPAGYALRGMIAEAAEDFAGADESYEEAAEVGGPRAIAGELFTPVPPNLLWKYGRLVRRTEPETAVRVIRKALRSGIRGSGEYPERKAYVDLGKALQERRDRSDEAAEAFWEAGRRYAWIGDEASALSYLDRAAALAPRNARYAFERAEILRIRAVREDGTVDRTRLAEAAQAWQQAYQLAIPAPDAAWAYITQALIVHEESGDLYRPRVSWRAAAVLERGLLADPANVRIMGQLSLAHRLLGNRWTALGLTERALDRDGADELAFDQHLLALMEVERFDEALALLDRHGLTSDQPWLVVRKGQLLVSLRRPQEALDLFDSVTPSDPSLHDLWVALCHQLLGNRAEARKAAQRVRDRQDANLPGRRTYLSAWASYLLGRYDDAAGTYERMVAEDAYDAAIRCDLGQVLLARGDDAHGDLTRGRDLLLDGIAMTRSVFALSDLATIELPCLLGMVADGGLDADDGPAHDPARRPDPEHGAAVRAVVDGALSALRERSRFLSRATSAAEELGAALAEPSEPAMAESALAGVARLAVADGLVEQALDHYLALSSTARSAEAAYGVERAAQRLRTAADDLARAGDHSGALDAYRRLLARLERAPGPPVELVASTHLRTALAAAELDQLDVFAEHVARAFPPDLPNRALPGLRSAVSDTIVRPEQYWKVVDTAHELRDRPGGGHAEMAAARRLVSVLDLSAVLRTGRNDVDAARVFPLAVPLAIRVGAGLLGTNGAADPPLVDLMNLMRSQVQADTGVLLPVIDLQPLPGDADPGAYEIDLYEVPVARGQVPTPRYFVLDGRPGTTGDGAPAADPLTQEPGHWIEHASPEATGAGQAWTAERFVVRCLEGIIRTNLPRLFSIDDVGLWLSSIPSSRIEAADADRLSRADRLELLRLLRLLLREQVPILDRNEIFGLVCKAGPEWSALDLLPAVRRRISGRLAPARALASPVTLPAELEAMAAAGLSPTDPAIWELPRDRVRALADRIVAWYGGSSGQLVVVRDARLRPFLWRLLVGLVPGSVWVLTEEELQ